MIHTGMDESGDFFCSSKYEHVLGFFFSATYTSLFSVQFQFNDPKAPAKQNHYIIKTAT